MALPEVHWNSVLEKSTFILDLLAHYHHHQVHNFERFPRQGPVIMLTNHSLATYDGFLLGKYIYQHSGRFARGLGDDLIFKIPKISEWAYSVGLVPASVKNAKELLRRGEIVGLAPGGMRESIKPSRQAYKILWNDRMGFARLAVEENVPVVLAACPKGDQIFQVFENPLTDILYKKLKVPFPLFRGLGPTLIPRPVTLTHEIEGPFLPSAIAQQGQAGIEYFHHFIVERMQELMKRRSKRAPL